MDVIGQRTDRWAFVIIIIIIAAAAIVVVVGRVVVGIRDRQCLEKIRHFGQAIKINIVVIGNNNTYIVYNTIIMVVTASANEYCIMYMIIINKYKESIGSSQHTFVRR